MNIFKNPYGITFPVNYKYVHHSPPTDEYLDKWIPNRIDLPNVNGMFMTSYHVNEHHIYPSIYWSTYISQICEFLGLPHKPSHFRKCKYFSEDGKTDLSYHDLISCSPDTFTVKYIGEDGKLNTSHSLRNIARNLPSKTNYHRLFIGAHTCGYITNKYATTDEQLLISCDSMFIPVIPIIAHYCKSIMFVDNRSNQEYISKYINGHTFTKFIISRLYNHMFPEFIRSTFK